MSPGRRRPYGWRRSLTSWLDHYGDPALVLAALVTIPLLIAESADLSPGDQQMIRIANWAIYGAFALNFVVRMAITRDRYATLRSLQWDLVVVVGQPLLALSSVESNGLGVALVRLAAVLLRTFSRGHVLRRTWHRAVAHPLRLLVGAVPFLWLLFSAIVLHAERRWGPEGTVQTIGEALWWGAATMATVGYGDISPKSPTARFAAIGTMVVGIGAFSILTAKLAESLLVARDDAAEHEVDVDDHVVLLGWSPKVVTIVRELIEAGAHRQRNDIVVLCERPRGEAERELFARIPELTWSSTVVTCRTGSSRDPVALARLGLDRARSVVVTESATDPTDAVMALLAILGSAEARPDLPIVVEIDQAATAAAVRAAFAERVLIVEPVSLIARITAQSCRQPGLGLAYEELLDFAGSELYVLDVPAAAGLPFGELAHRFPTCCAVGLVDDADRVELAPDAGRPVRPGDRIVVLAEDPTTATFDPTAVAPPGPGDAVASKKQTPDHLIIVGWNQLAPRLLDELDHYLDSTSTVTVLLDAESGHECSATLTEGTLRVLSADGPAHAAALDDAVAGGCDHVVILGDHLGDLARADARTMLRALQVRRADTDRRVRSMVIELLDERNAPLARQATAGEFIISDRLTSLLMAQITETPERAVIFDQLLRADGPELYAYPLDWYATPGTTTFGALALAATRRNEVAIGVRITASADDPDALFGIVMNPAKAAALTLDAADAVIVLGEGPRGRATA